MEKRNVLIYVANQRFNLSTTDSEEYVIEVGEKVDLMIKGISNNNPRLNRDGCATLCALSLCDDLTKLQKKQEEIREEIKTYLKDAKALREENEALKAQIEELKLKAESIPTIEEEKDELDEGKLSYVPANNEPKNEASQKPNNNSESRDFRHDKKKRHNHQEKRNQNNRPWTQQQKEQKSAPATINAPYEDEEKGLPEEPPMQYSIFDTDFI